MLRKGRRETRASRRRAARSSPKRQYRREAESVHGRKGWSKSSKAVHCGRRLPSRRLIFIMFFRSWKHSRTVNDEGRHFAWEEASSLDRHKLADIVTRTSQLQRRSMPLIKSLASTKRLSKVIGYSSRSARFARLSASSYSLETNMWCYSLQE